MPLIELPQELYDDIEEKRKEKGFNSVSEAVRYLGRRWIDDED